ncbi:hypothetical protein ACFYTS_06825 [Nocardia sp. NPDC004151]|uniref:hypothetical protein n=1 Tax=Nocardia sp. NPDC004151 TaxID=3364304 RepID=UPI0036CBC5D9
MRTFLAAVGIATALTVGAGQAVAAPPAFADAPAPVAETGSSSGSVGGLLNTGLAFLLCIFTPTGCTANTDGGNV